MTWLTLFNRIGPYLAVLAIVAGIAFGGWYGRGLYEDSQELSELKGAEKAIKAAMARESPGSSRTRKSARACAPAIRPTSSLSATLRHPARL